METANGENSTIQSMMNLGRIGEAKPISRTPIEFGSEDERTNKLIAQGVIADERFAENSLRKRSSANNIQAIENLSATMDNFIPASKNTFSRLDDRLSPDKLDRMGFGSNRDWAEPLNTTASGLLEQMKMISEVLWQDGRYQDESIRERIKDQITDSKLTSPEKEMLKRVADGFHHIRNMSLHFTASAGDPAVWVATESKGGKVSDVEADRISFEHLRDQIKIYPKLAVLLEELDDAVVRNISEKSFDITKFFESIHFGKDLGLDGEPLWRREYLCDLALNWYRIAGFPDIRKFGNRTKQYNEKMPKGITSGLIKPNNAEYVAAIKQPNCDIGLTPYFFLMDPLSLWADILKNNKEVIARIRTSVNKSKKTEHSIPNLAWRPAAWDLIDKALSVDAVGPEELNSRSLKELEFHKLSDEAWENFLHGKDAKGDDINGYDLLQKNNIKFAEKAMNARGALWACLDVINFNFDTIGKLFGAVGDLIRTEESDTLFNREKVYPVLFQVLVNVGREAGLAGISLNIKKDDMEFYLKAMRLKFRPVNVISDAEIRELKGYCKN